MSKEQYWKNRKAGLRGQGPKLKPKLLEKEPGKHMVNIGGQLTMVNRQTARSYARN